MKKKILIGSIIAVALLLLMPSIPAIQQKTIEDKAYSDFVEAKDFDELFASIREKLTDINTGTDIGILGPGGAFILWLLEMLGNIFNLIKSIVEFGIFKLMIVVYCGALLDIIAVFLVMLRNNGLDWERVRVLLKPIINILYFIVYGELPPWPECQSVT